MIDRFKIAFIKLLLFAQNPVAQLENDKSDYKELRNIASATVLMGFTLEALKVWDNGVLFGTILIMAVLLAWPLSWVLLNIGAGIFEYYLEWIAYKQILNFQPSLLQTQRIMAYSSISFVLSVLPGEYLSYLGALVSLALTAVGLKTLYKLNLGQGVGLALVYNLLILAIVIIAALLINLLV